MVKVHRHSYQYPQQLHLGIVCRSRSLNADASNPSKLSLPPLLPPPISSVEDDIYNIRAAEVILYPHVNQPIATLDQRKDFKISKEEGYRNLKALYLYLLIL